MYVDIVISNAFNLNKHFLFSFFLSSHEMPSHLIKILEKIFAKKVDIFLETHQKINPKQLGFGSGGSCLSQLPVHHNKILEKLESQTMSMLSTWILKKPFIKSATAYY